MTIQPLFLFSLPRSGSTMFQRELAQYSNFATTSEPWFVLGLLDPSAVDDGLATFGFGTYRIAMEDLISSLPNGRADWNEAMRNAALSIYKKLSAGDNATPSVTYFIDKTPRYSLSPEAIHQMFPDAPIIILWRNPLAVAASMMSTWSNGRWNLDRFTQDLQVALPRLVEFTQANESQVLSVRYEDAVADLSSAIGSVFNHLSLSTNMNEIDEKASSVALKGRMGDPTHGLNYSAATQVETRWKIQFGNPLRRYWARRYLAQIGPERLAVMGYDMNVLMAELDSCRGFTRHLASDLFLMPLGLIKNLLGWRLIARQFRRLLKGKPVVEMS